MDLRTDHFLESARNVGKLTWNCQSILHLSPESKIPNSLDPSRGLKHILELNLSTRGFKVAALDTIINNPSSDVDQTMNAVESQVKSFDPNDMPTYTIRITVAIDALFVSVSYRINPH